MIRVTKRSLVWAFTSLSCGLVIFQTWYSIQWTFTSADHTDTSSSLPSSSATASSPLSAFSSTLPSLPQPTLPTQPALTSHARYMRDYTTLFAYTIILLILYSLCFVYTRLCRASLATNFIPCSIDQTYASLEQQTQQSRPSIIKIKPSSLYLFLRRWWHYELGCCDMTFRVGTYMTLLGLASMHVLFVFWPLLYHTDSTATDKYLQHQLLSNRMAQLAVVDIAVAVGLSVRTSGFWRCIGLHNGSSTLPWHRWFSRLGIFCVIYHGCFQWTKHYHQHFPTGQQQQQQLDIDFPSSNIGGLVLSSSSITCWDLLTWNPRYLTGNLMILCLLVLCLGSHPLVREKWYWLFRLTHGVSFLVLVATGMCHHWAFSVFYVAVMGLWLLDLVARWRSTQVAPILALDAVTSDVVKLQIVLESTSSLGGLYLPGQYVFCSFSGSKWKDVWWSHPFSISRVERLEQAKSTETSESQILTFYIKAYGKQTKQLFDVASIKEKWPVVRLGAPLGYSPAYCPWTDFYRLYPVVVLVAEGIGITPWMAVLQSLAIGSSDNNNDHHHLTTTEHVHLVWTVRDVTMVQALQHDIQAMMASCKHRNERLKLDCHIYVTGTEAYQRQIREQNEIPSQSSSLAANDQPSQQRYLNSHQQQGRPDYPAVLESIRLEHDGKDVALGLCAHETSVQVCGNLARSSRFSNDNAYWNVKSERFDL